MQTSQSPGQIAYAAYWRAWPALPLPWERLRRTEQRAWEAAAQAVLALRTGPVWDNGLVHTISAKKKRHK